jgi:hypothetical protein
MLCIGDDLLFTISPDTPDVVVGEEEENRECVRAPRRLRLALCALLLFDRTNYPTPTLTAVLQPYSTHTNTDLFST